MDFYLFSLELVSIFLLTVSIGILLCLLHKHRQHMDATPYRDAFRHERVRLVTLLIVFDVCYMIKAYLWRLFNYEENGPFKRLIYMDFVFPIADIVPIALLFATHA